MLVHAASFQCARYSLVLIPLGHGFTVLFHELFALFDSRHRRCDEEDWLIKVRVIFHVECFFWGFV